MTEKEVINEYNLTIRNYKGDQTQDELRNPCEKCLFMYSDFSTNQIRCHIYKMPVRECLRMCINNYRIDIENLVDAMLRKTSADNKRWNEWINSFHDYVDPEDGVLIGINKPDDMIRVYETLERTIGD